MITGYSTAVSVRSLVAFFAGALVLLVGVQNASSADLGSGPHSYEAVAPLAPAEQWSVVFTPYGWLPFLKGDETVKGRTVAIDVDPVQVLKHLDAAPWMSYAEARRGPFVLYNDIFYAKLGLDADGVRSRSTLSGVGGTLGASLGVDFQQLVVELGGAYEIARWGSAGSFKDANTVTRFTAIDILAGARYWRQELDINLALSGTLNLGGLVLSGTRAAARSGTVDWVDPLIGLRVRHQLAPGQEILLRGDVGGFDVGSKFSWNLLAAYSWEFAARDGIIYSGLLGYRALQVDYEQGQGSTKYEYDVLQHGPILGLSMRF